MPLPTPSEGQSEDEFIASCMGNDTMKEEFPDHKQRLAVCFSQFRKTRDFYESDPVPLFRAFEHGGKWYIHGWGAIFTSPDSHRTVMTREVVKASIEKVLSKFPAIRYMHYKPFAQIDFQNEVNGIRTFLSDDGFYILGEVYPEAEIELRMVSKGHWGLSWSMSPHGVETEVRRARDGNYYPHFVKGLIHEFSVVDAPSHLDCAAYVLQRGINPSNAGGNSLQSQGSKEKMEKKDIEEMFKEHDTKLLEDIKRMIAEKKEEKTTEKILEERDAKLMRFFADELAKLEKKQEQPTVFETAVNKANTEIKRIEDTVTTLKSAVTSLQSKGEDASSLEKRIIALEKEKDTIVKAAAAAVGETVKSLEKRLSTLENAPDEKSEASVGGQKVYARGHGITAMLEAAFQTGDNQ